MQKEMSGIMDKLTSLYEDMIANGVMLLNVDMSKSNSKAATICINNEYAVFADYKVMKTISDEACAIAHEYGHVKTGTTHNITSPLELVMRHEYKANKWAIHMLIPYDELLSAYKQGIVEVYELAEHFVRKAVHLYERNDYSKLQMIM